MPSPALTWSSLLAHYSAPAWQPLASLARTYYAQQGQLLPAAGYLALPPAAAAAPFVGSAAARQLVAEALPQPGPAADEPLAAYFERARPEARPLLAPLLARLQAQGTTPAAWAEGLAQDDTYLATLLDNDYWAALASAWQQSIYQQLDAEDRAPRLLAAQAADPAQAAALAATYARLGAALPTATLETLRDLPANELARALWTPAPAPDDAALAALLGRLHTTAQALVAANYPDAELAGRLVAALPPALGGVAQALLAPGAAGQAPLAQIAELATDPQPVQARLAELPANHPLVYALAAWFRALVQDFLAAEIPAAAPAAPAPLLVQGQLLGQHEAPLPGFELRPTQMLASQQGREVPLGALTTDADGRFALRVPRDLYLADADDAVAEAPAQLRLAVRRPGQVAEAPALTLELAPTADQPTLTLRTDLAPGAAAPASAAVASLPGELPAGLAQLLADHGIASLADLRAAGGSQALAAGQLDPTEALAARRLDALAQFEVVSADAAFNEQVVAAGFYAPAEVLGVATADAFADYLTAADTDADEPARAARRAQATAFYQQAANVQALSQMLGLLSATGFAATDSPAATSDESAATATAEATDPTEAAETTEATGTTSDAPAARRFSLARAAAPEQTDAEADYSEATFTATDGDASADAETDDDAATNARLSGVTNDGRVAVAGSFNPAPTGARLPYAAAAQCDCPACRSAVSPTAYLAALLKYATTSLRVAASGGNAPGPYGSTGVNPGLLAVGSALTARDYQEKFLQPFCDLGVSCQSADEQVCQYRLAIEVIQAYWRTRTSPAPGANDFLRLRQARPYVEGVLEALLQALGTSLAELRAATAASSPALAARLQLPLATLTTWQSEFGTARLTDERPLDEVEAALARAFGLAATAPDPLRTGQLLSPNTGLTQLVRWSLQGVEWGVNTDDDGLLTLRIAPDSTQTPSEPRVTVYQGAVTEDNVVARGTLLLSSPATSTYTGLLHPQHGSGLRGSVVATLKGASDEEPQDFSISVVPAAAAGRQQLLAADWLAQDAAAASLLQAHDQPSWTGQPYLVDPDLLGPDDFRVLDPAQPFGGNRAYQLWRRRYDFVQTQVGGSPLGGAASPAAATLAGLAAVGGLGSFIDGLTTRALAYPQDTNAVPLTAWPVAAPYAGPGTTLLARLHAEVAAADPATTPATAATLATLGLSIEAMQRLYDLWQQNRTLALTPAEGQEALDIVRQTVKVRFADTWRAEETASPAVALGLDLFQSALHEPLPGVWETVRPTEFGLTDANTPRLDPDETTPLDLPDLGLGSAAADRWRTHQAELLTKRQAILAYGAATTGLARADAMLRYALAPTAGAPLATLPGPVPGGTLDAAADLLQNEAAPQHAAAVAYFGTTLALRPAEAATLFELRAQAGTQPTEALWLELATLLARVWKRAVAYRTSYTLEDAPATQRPSWLTQERPAGTAPTLDYLLGVRKHRLLKWRAPAERRAAWGQALALAGQRPLIDPDQLVPGDFRQAGELSRNTYDPAPATPPFRNPAYDLYRQRQAWVNTCFADYQGKWTAAQAAADPTAAGWALASEVLGASRAELEELHRLRQLGTDVSAPLRRLLLPPAGLDLLYDQITAAPGADRAAEVPHLLVQVRRQRQYAAWAREELALELVPQPRYFREPAPEAESLATLPWRSSAVARRQWQRRLAARFGQAQAVAAAQQQAVRTAEDQYLPLLRDALLLAKVGAPTDALATRATALAEVYFIDFQAVCCQHTTRVALASEVLQQVFLNLRGGLAANGLALPTAGTSFEQDWQWLSSFERWRSLMFLYLYPQNVLLPALKPGQSTQFRTTVQGLRQGTGLSPAGARQYMDDYQAFLSDQGTLEVQAAVQVRLSAVATATAGFTTTTGADVSVQVAVSGGHAAYANLHYLAADQASQNSFSWTRLPGTDPVERVVGATAYRPATQERYVYVFALLREPQKNTLATTAAPLYLAYQRLNLRTLSWEDDYTRLELSGTGALEPRNLLVAACPDETLPPLLTGVRNRVEPLYTEYPFSMPAPAAGYSAKVSGIVGEVYNMDLFRATLDAQGTGIGSEQTNTVFLVSELTLLGCVLLNNIQLEYTMGVQVGRQNPTVLNTFKLGINSPSKYITSERLVVFSNSNAQGNPGGIGYNTPVFTSSWQANLFLDFQRATQRITSGYTTMDVAATMGSPSVNTNAADTQVPLAASGLTIQASGFRLTDVTPVTISGTTDYYPLYNYKTEVYYSYTVDTFTTHTLSTHKVSLVNGFVQTSVGLSQGPQDYFGSPADAVTTLATPSIFVGPVLRAGYGKAVPAVADCLLLSRAANPGLGLTAITTLQQGGTTAVLHQSLPALPPLFSSLSAADQDARRTALAAVQAATPLGTLGFVSSFVSEAYYALPMLLAQELTRTRNYELALHYYRLVYDYTQLAAPGSPDPKRLVYPALAAGGAASFDTALAWLHDPYNPYTLAALRPGAHLDYVVMSVVRCLLAYADDEFTRDTTESVARARTYYELAARLLRQDVTQRAVPGTAALLDPFDAGIPAAWLGEWQALKGVLARTNQRTVLEQLLRGTGGTNLTTLWAEAQAGTRTWDSAFGAAWVLVNGQFDALPGGYMSLCRTTGAAATGSIDLPAGALPANAARPYVPFLDGTAFCVPTNPVPFALALQAELNLFKIRSCRNIAGIQRELDPYAAATDTTTGLPTLSSTGQLARTGRLVVPATQFRYAYIVERARQLVSLAQQTEASLLSALEKRDAEAYNLLKARQDIASSQATVQLQTLRVTEAEDQVDLSGLNLEKSEYMQQHYTDLLNDGLNGWEIAQMVAIGVAGAAQAVAAASAATNLFDEVVSFGGVAVGAAANVAAAIANTAAQLTGLQASYQRREDEWSYQQGLANKDIKIGQQQIQISNDQLKVVGQEKRIAQLNLDHASAVLTFLTTKFTNAELYDWMSGILENAYGYFLQQATATARLAEQQLAFERQEVPTGLIQEDYYSAPADDASMASGLDGGASTGGTDRKGLTGSVRLLQDLTRLDEYAFETTRRKLQLTKTISLAQAFPTEFGRFRETGVLPFACQPEWFDQDFPGQYLRIVRRVRTSVIALVPPVEGIKARLSTAGTSHVTVNGAPFQTLALPRPPEAVALTAPTNATGLFELEQQSTELLYPFEGLGVDVPWQFSMQPASNPGLDYAAVADVLISLDYTALESPDYARQVVQQLGTERRQLVALSLRDRFADEWYDLHHAADLAPADRYQARLTLTAADLPRHLRNAQVSQVTVFVDAPLDDDASAPGAFTDRSALEVRLSRGQGLGGSARTNQYGVISTRTGLGLGPLYTGNATGLLPLLGSAPAGAWTLAIGQGRLRERLDAGRVNDIYLILEVTGDAPTYQL